MPIDVDVYDSDRLSIRICDPSKATQVNILCSALLNSQLIRKDNCWTVTWHDFCQLREKLDKMLLTEGRTATDPAIKWIKDQLAYDVEIQHIKEGKQNHLLNGMAKSLKMDPYEDQYTGVRFLATREKAILADEMGIGKTLQLLATFVHLKNAGLARWLLVVCPNSVKQGWVKEVAKHTNLTVTALGNGSEQLKADFDRYRMKRTDVCVVHYDAFVSQKSKNNRRQKPYSVFVDDLLKIPWDVIDLDEAHQVKTLEAKRSQATLYVTQKARGVNKKPSRIYLATGTPVSESPLDAWAVFHYIDPSQLPKTYSKFENYFTVKQKKEAGFKRWSEVTGYRNLGELKQLLHRHMIRRLKSDIKGMPDKVAETRYCQLEGSQRTLYNDIKKGVYDTIIQNPDDKLSIAFAMTKCIRLRQTLNHPTLVDREGTSAKHKLLDEIVDDVLADPMAKIMIWTEFRAAVDIIAERLKKYGVIKLVGGTSQADIAHWSKNWDTMPERVAIGLPIFGGTGIDFLSRCRTAVYVEPPYSTILFRQSMDRIHRRVGLGTSPIDLIKSSPATLIFIQAENTIDELVYKILGRKGNLVDALLTEDDKLIELGLEELLEYLR
jgi:SNF2 family DNA or RNA helicase